jgi:segregation and condensation protein A
MEEKEEISEPSVKQEQVHDILFNREIGWQEIIYDLINTEQLDPWDVNLTILSGKYLDKIKELEEADFFVSSKVLLAASLLLRIKSEILLNKYIKSIDDILFGRTEQKKKYSMERIELDEQIPELIPRSPMPRFKKVTLKELVESLNKAITTENRRIKKAIINQNALRETGISLPKRKFNIKDKIKNIYERLTGHFGSQEKHKKIHYSEFVGKEKQEKLDHFSPLLHLENQKKVWLHQEEHFGEIHIWERQSFWKHKGDPFEDLKELNPEPLEEFEDKFIESDEDENIEKE